MNTLPIRLLLAAALAGSLSLAACDEAGQDNLPSPDAPGGSREEHRDDNVRPGDASRPGDAARPGGPVRTGDVDAHPGGDMTKPADNTVHNKGDAAEGAKTPFDQSEKPADIKITADIRKSILGAEGMSTNADNVKIITANGVVAVRGVVESQSEIDMITKIVSETPGVTASDIQLSIDPN